MVSVDAAYDRITEPDEGMEKRTARVVGPTGVVGRDLARDLPADGRDEVVHELLIPA